MPVKVIAPDAKRIMDMYGALYARTDMSRALYADEVPGEMLAQMQERFALTNVRILSDLLRRQQQIHG